MKVPGSMRSLYDAQWPLNEVLKEKVDHRLKSLKHQGWHYESRLKELESFALKVESGRFSSPEALEDFFACTLVVRNAAEVSEAEALIIREFAFKERRPRTDDSTHKDPDSFPFDDLRLYVAWRDDPTLRPTSVNGLLFEVQIKTFLQHAWSIATYDLVYKTAEPHWGKQRIAFQIKAMLEHAEVSIQEAEKLSAGAALAKTTRASRSLSEAIAVLRAVWASDDLPKDLRRLAENVCAVAEALRLDMADLKRVLEAEGAEGRGAHTRNLSPFGVVIASLFRRRRDQLIGVLSSPHHKKRPKIVISAEVELPPGVDTTTWSNAIVLSS